MPMRQSCMCGVPFSAYNHLHLAFLIASPLIDSYNQVDWCFSILFIPHSKISSNYLRLRLKCLVWQKTKNSYVWHSNTSAAKWGLLRSVIIVDIKMISSFCGISAFSYLCFPVLRTSESVEVSQWDVVLAYLLCLAHMFDKICPCPFTCTFFFPWFYFIWISKWLMLTCIYVSYLIQHWVTALWSRMASRQWQVEIHLLHLHTQSQLSLSLSSAYSPPAHSPWALHPDSDDCILEAWTFSF